jgi:negative regulator of sigma E activity
MHRLPMNDRLMKRGSLVALLLAAASLGFVSAKPDAPSLDATLQAAIAASSTVSYTGVVQVTRIGDHSSEAAVYRIEHRAPDLTRRAYTAPSSLSGDSVISNGQLDFSIDARRHRIVETRNDALGDSVALNANVALLRENYRVVRKDGETFEGRDTVDLTLVNKHTERTTMVVRLDRSSSLVLEKKEFAPNGALVSELRFDEIRFTRAIPPADFALPKSYALVRGPIFGAASANLGRVVRNAGFAALEPRLLPGGFSAVEGNLVALRGIPTVHILYSDGIRTLSLFENTQPSALDMTRLEPKLLVVNGRNAQYAEDGTTALLAWNDGSLYYTLVGELSLAELQGIADQIRKP